jgi:acyl-CoA reductase-like NAD-dependent aldehyde dehydrogenase
MSGNRILVDPSRHEELVSRFGSVWINDYFVLGPEVPQGGFGSSGFGKEGGLPGVDELTRLKQVSVSLT